MRRQFLRAAVVLGLIIVGMPAYAYAQYTSPTYKIEEIFIGGGGQQEACSGNLYCANQSVGGTAVGDTSSNGFRAQAGSQSSGEPTLEVSLTNTVIDLGVLNASGTAAASANFTVSNYLSDGYIVRIYGNPPTNFTGPGTHSLTALNSPSLSVPGDEQFGINLVANDTPGIGTDPVDAPDASFSFGYASAGYNTKDYYKYVSGDTIAQSDSSSGETQYTVSIIANIDPSTPGGQYVALLAIQVIAKF